ncbi:DUF4249 domain-containing protein [Nafulsella turpanensis]|uniref:DUF4249 domain-containing protein n=1 Tax=Nafulsella turpanensis TaxID=1265690 RepID=UPI000349C097|nr:DUF4249 domain-containing protein [Nafulsella turpanensis]
MRKYTTFFYLLLIFLSGCIDPIDFKFDGQTQHLVVEAKFTNEASINYVKLSKSSPYDYPYNIFVEQATVYITSKEGEFFPFRHIDNGYYLPVGEAKGETGGTYTLHIENEGKKYQSNPVTIQPPVKIDSVYFEYAEVWVAEKGKKEKELKPGYRVLVDYVDPEEEDNFYRWSYNSEFEVHTQPWDYVETSCLGCPRPDPKKCCSICYIEEEGELLPVNNDRLSDGKKVIAQEVFFIPFEKYLNYKYKLQLYQYSTTEEAFNFFKVIKEQSESTGGIFDPPPSEAKGNIFNIDDEGEQVLGIFDAAGVSRRDITLTFDEIPYYKPPFVYPDDCRLMENSTTEKPENW